jgi:hypothetical protein
VADLCVGSGVVAVAAAAGVLKTDELPIAYYDALNVSEAVTAIIELTTPRGRSARSWPTRRRRKTVRASFSAAPHVAAIAIEVVGIG